MNSNCLISGLRQNKTTKEIIKTLLLTLLVASSEFTFFISWNEADVLPYSYSVFNPSWLANDWFLNLNIEYRYLFGYIIGPFIHYFGFIKTSLIGRLLTYLIFSLAYKELIKTANIKFIIGLVSLVLFLTYFNQDLGAGEWVIGGLETKVISYIFVILSLKYILKYKYREALIFAGLSLSFHLLVGAYHTICLGIIIIFQLIESKYSFPKVLRNIHFYLIPGSFGIYGAIVHLNNTLNSKAAAIAENAWEVYVNFRVPHHTIPNWDRDTYIWLGIFVLFNIYILLYRKKYLKDNYLVTYCLSAIFFILIGLYIYYWGNNSLLRFYFFRLGDSMIPLITLPLILKHLFKIKLLDYYYYLRPTAYIILVILSGYIFYLYRAKHIQEIASELQSFNWKKIQKRDNFDPKMTNWIKKNTPKDAIFIIPFNRTDFYIDAERPVFVTRKHIPQRKEDILEWSKRLKLLNNGNDLSASTHLDYSKLTKKDVLTIYRLYPVNYILMPKNSNLDFKKLYSTDKYILYQLPQTKYQYTSFAK